jgi:glucose-6-phosphate 1-dehydrogenase
LATTQPVQSLLLFGATGDLARRMLLPSLFGLDADGLLPKGLRIVATARSAHDDASFRTLAEAALRQAIEAERLKPEPMARFLGRLRYVPLDASDPAQFSVLAAAVDPARQPLAIFLSTAPSLFRDTIAGLAASGLASENARLALEKPLGNDLASSRDINDAVAEAFPERRTFRIDHYLGKETVQNLLALRFGNSLLEPLWNAQHIEHIQLTVSETVGLEGRIDYFDGTGSLRDMVQNHMLQLLALVAMEPPAQFDASAIRNEKVKVLRSLRRIGLDTAATHSVIGQYRPGAVSGVPVPGYVEELKRDRIPRPSLPSRPMSTTGAGRACPSTCGRASACPPASRRSSSSSVACRTPSSPARARWCSRTNWSSACSRRRPSAC